MIEGSTEEGRNKYKTNKNDIKVSKYCLTRQSHKMVKHTQTANELFESV